MAEEEKSFGIIVLKNRRVLLVKSSRPNAKWGFPKGHLEGNESELEAALRETTEETGLKNLDLVDGFKEQIEFFYRKNNQLVHKTVTFFLANAIGDEEVLVPNEEEAEYYWAELSEAKKKIPFKNYYPLLEKIELLLSKN